jgi:hypothetical protein
MTVQITMTQEQIDAVWASEEPENAALEYVQQGEATLIEVNRNSIVGTSGRLTSKLEKTSGSEIGGWDTVYARVVVESGGTILFADDSCVIIAGGLKDEGVAEFIDMMESVAEIIDDDAAEADELSRDGDSGGFTH